MEVNTTRRAAGLKEKIPDIQKTLATVRFLQKRKVRPEQELPTRGVPMFYSTERALLLFVGLIHANWHTLLVMC